MPKFISMACLVGLNWTCAVMGSQKFFFVCVRLSITFLNDMKALEYRNSFNVDRGRGWSGHATFKNCSFSINEGDTMN